VEKKRGVLTTDRGGCTYSLGKKEGVKGEDLRKQTGMKKNTRRGLKAKRGNRKETTFFFGEDERCGSLGSAGIGKMRRDKPNYVRERQRIPLTVSKGMPQ